MNDVDKKYEGRLTICNGRSTWYRAIQTKSDFFKAGERFVFLYKHGCLSILRQGFNPDSNAKNCSQNKKSGQYYFQIAQELPTGFYEIEPDESNYDVLKCYLINQP